MYVNWADRSSNETRFVIERSTGGGPFAVVGTAAANKTGFTDSTVNPGTGYAYRVKAVAGALSSPWSSVATATTPAGFAISRLVLVNADTDADVMTLSDGVELNLAALPTRNVNIRADVAGSIGSVRFGLDGNGNYRTENNAPYTIGGDAAGGDYLAWTPAAGSHTLTVTPFASANATGAAGAAVVVAFTVVEPPAPPAAPASLTASRASATSVALHWSDVATNELGFHVYRSTNGTDFDVITSVGAGVTSYTDGGLTTDTTYYYRVRAHNAAGSSAVSNTASATPAEAPAGGVLASPPQASVNAAIASPLIRYDRDISGGSHSTGAIWGGASITLAVAAYTGNTTADARLLQQMRYTITGGNDISANGGYATQHERHVTGMYAIARHTPRVWNQLTAAERHKIDLLMKAALVSSAFTTSDNNPYIKAGSQQYSLDGSSNLHRDWNPNYREGMVGMMLVAPVYFGSAAAASAVLEGYDHAAFVAELNAAGLTNIHETFTWKAANPSSNAPSGSTIEAGVRGYRYKGLPLTNTMGIYERLVTYTYGRTVEAGLNDGAGMSGGGKILSGASTLPNKGQVGMLLEFDSMDAEGPRSSAHYAYDGFRPHQTNVLVLIVGGHWNPESTVVQEAVRRINIGNTDLWYKLEHGYRDYHKGQVRGDHFATDAGRGYQYTRPMWDDVLRPFLGLA